MTPDEFAKEIAKDVRSQNYSFLFGNGINYILLKKQCIKWDTMLENIGKNYNCSKITGVNNTEYAGLLDIKARNPENNKGEKSNINKEIQKNFIPPRPVQCECSILDFAWDNGHHILTTNFDMELEQYFQQYKNRGEELLFIDVVAGDNAKAKSNSNTYYCWNRYWGLFRNSASGQMPDGGHDIWHMHGRVDTRSSCSLIASMTKYCGAIRKVANMGSFSDDNWGGKNTWLEYFIKRPLIIAGVDLGEQEIFPRFLLMKKAQWRTSQLLNKKSYYLVSKMAADQAGRDGRNFLAALGFTIVEFDTYDQIYNHPLWENLQATKKAK